jgi:hypothetical protein
MTELNLHAGMICLQADEEQAIKRLLERDLPQ